MKLNDRFSRIQIIAQKRGGKCISSIYKNMKTKMSFVCQSGHKWKTKGENILRGRWCPVCAGKNKDLDYLHSLAKGKRGKCLATVYNGVNKLHEWECQKGHRFLTRPNEIRMVGTWCQKCKLDDYLQKAKEYAYTRGGECLSTSYKSSKSKLHYRCRDGHTWWSRDCRHNGSWCPYCAKWSYLSEEKCRYVFSKIFGKSFPTTKSVISPFELDGYNPELRLAFEFHGEYHYVYIPVFHRKRTLKDVQDRDRQKLQICQDKGIQLIVIPYFENHSDEGLFKFIIQNTGLKARWNDGFFNEFYQKQHRRIQEMQSLAHKHGGLFLSASFQGSGKKHTWSCREGHQWRSTPVNVKQGHWCRRCSFEHLWSKARNPLTTAEEFAAQYNCILISNQYTNNKLPLVWECSREHKWQASLNAMRLRASKNRICLQCIKETKNGA